MSFWYITPSTTAPIPPAINIQGGMAFSDVFVHDENTHHQGQDGENPTSYNNDHEYRMAIDPHYRRAFIEAVEQEVNRRIGRLNPVVDGIAGPHHITRELGHISPRPSAVAAPEAGPSQPKSSRSKRGDSKGHTSYPRSSKQTSRSAFQDKQHPIDPRLLRKDKNHRDDSASSELGQGIDADIRRDPTNPNQLLSETQQTSKDAGRVSEDSELISPNQTGGVSDQDQSDERRNLRRQPQMAAKVKKASRPRRKNATRMLSLPISERHNTDDWWEQKSNWRPPQEESGPAVEATPQANIRRQNADNRHHRALPVPRPRTVRGTTIPTGPFSQSRRYIVAAGPSQPKSTLRQEPTPSEEVRPQAILAQQQGPAATVDPLGLEGQNSYVSPQRRDLPGASGSPAFPNYWEYFKYNQYGELEPSRSYSSDELTKYLHLHPNLDGITLWIQRTPPENQRRGSPDAGNCRFEDCRVSQENTIRAGEARVAFDESSSQNPDHDPQMNAGYVHLQCLEQNMNIGLLCFSVNVRAEGRVFASEPNPMILSNYNELMAAERFIEFCHPEGQLPASYPDKTPEGYLPYENSLTDQLDRCRNQKPKLSKKAEQNWQRGGKAWHEQDQADNNQKKIDRADQKDRDSAETRARGKNPELSRETEPENAPIKMRMTRKKAKDEAAQTEIASSMGRVTRKGARVEEAEPKKAPSTKRVTQKRGMDAEAQTETALSTERVTGKRARDEEAEPQNAPSTKRALRRRRGDGDGDPYVPMSPGKRKLVR